MSNFAVLYNRLFTHIRENKRTADDKHDAELKAKGKAAKEASRPLAYVSTDIKNKAMRNIAADLRSQTKEIVAANQLDLAQAAENGINETMQDRFLLKETRLAGWLKMYWPWPDCPTL